MISHAPYIVICLLLMAGCRSAPDEPQPDNAADIGVEVRANTETPTGMVFVPGGRVQIGSQGGRYNEQPLFEARVAPFFMDAAPVTVAEFRDFVNATGYVTQAERFGNAGVFDPQSRQWRLVDGASWHHPRGPKNGVAPEDHPVTQVSWNDAAAYAAWAGKRLPTEIEWEHAARGGTNSSDRYAWGKQLTTNGNYRANTWQGTFPTVNTGADGYRYTSPVGAFGKTSLGLADMGGNVWEWTQDWYRPYGVWNASVSAESPQEQPGAQRQQQQQQQQQQQLQKVQRGGSFLCHPSWCHGYRVSARSHATPETSLFHVGFRCAQDVPPP